MSVIKSITINQTVNAAATTTSNVATTISPTPNLTSTPEPVSIVTTLTSVTPTNSKEKPDEGLSTAQIAGIAGGSAAGVLVIIIIAASIFTYSIHVVIIRAKCLII